MIGPCREANTVTMQKFLYAAAKKLGQRQHAVMVLDRADWHTAKQLKWPKCVTLLFLPPYSPELNPVERLWFWFREHHRSNRVCPDEPSLIYEATRSHRQLRRAEVRSTACGSPILLLRKTTSRLSRRRHWPRIVSGSQEAQTTTVRAGGHSHRRPAENRLKIPPARAVHETAAMSESIPAPIWPVAARPPRWQHREHVRNRRRDDRKSYLPV